MQDKEQALEQATQAALDASSAAEAQHTALAKQLASEKRDLQDQAAQVTPTFSFSLQPLAQCHKLCCRLCILWLLRSYILF